MLILLTFLFALPITLAVGLLRALIFTWPVTLIIGGIHTAWPAIPPVGWTTAFLICVLFTFLVPVSSSTSD